MPTPRTSRDKSPAQLHARPDVPKEPGEAGLHELLIGRKRRALLHVPEAAITADSAALAVMLHGAGGNADHGLGILAPYAEHANVIVLAPESRKTSWDIISDAQYGPDVQFIDECLRIVFSRYQIDAGRIALGGFSDGASYALSLGLSNGELFPKLLAFSPGFMAPVEIQNNPFIFISHGRRDEVLPIDRCSRHLVAVLRRHHLRLEYREFEGPHIVPPDCKERAVQILTES
jgi:phospholipase/carboxylesterase